MGMPPPDCSAAISMLPGQAIAAPPPDPNGSLRRLGGRCFRHRSLLGSRGALRRRRLARRRNARRGCRLALVGDPVHPPGRRKERSTGEEEGEAGSAKQEASP